MHITNRRQHVYLPVQGLISLALVLAAVSVPACAADAVTVSDAWVRATVPGQGAGAAYMEFKAAAPVVLVAAKTPVAGRAEFHTMTMDGGVMKMRGLPKLELATGQTELKPGGNHIMLIGLKHQLKVGEHVPLDLTVRDARGGKTTLHVDAEVRPVSTGGGAPMPMH